jgi:thymidylate synthase (FAD)
MRHLIHNHGFIELIDHMGSDLRIVNAARQSYDRESEELTAADEGLINYMIKNSHGTPFEHVNFTFKVKLPIFVAREWMRHRIGSFSEMSGRYVKLKQEFYMPGPEYVRSQVGKMGNYRFEPVREESALETRETFEDVYYLAWTYYEDMLKKGIAKEVARNVLPVSIYTQFIWTVNLRSLFNFIKLRSGKHALSEIRDYSEEIEKIVKLIVPVAYTAFNNNGRIVP